MNCYYCNFNCVKNGKQKNGIQKFYCRNCKKYQQEEYTNNACRYSTNEGVVRLLKEGNGVRSTSRILEISCTTVLKRIIQIAQQVIKPPIPIGKSYQVDELKTFVKKKGIERWITYAIRTDNKEVVDFRLGRRTKKNLGYVIETLLLSKPKKIYTDRFSFYRSLIPKAIHCKQWTKTNHIERKNLTLRTHLKRLNRKTICFSKSESILFATLAIYFWR